MEKQSAASFRKDQSHPKRRKVGSHAYLSVSLPVTHVPATLSAEVKAGPEAFIEMLPPVLIGKLVLALCHCPWYGEHVDEKLYKRDVYNLFLASPKLYKTAKDDPKCAQVIAEAAVEDSLAKFYAGMAEAGGYC